MANIDWMPDHFGDGFEMTYVNHPEDYSGKIKSTVIRKRTQHPTGKAMLYVHGFSDYFLQKEMARMFVEHGYDFYAVDLRKYGRSLIQGQKMFQVRDLREYFPDIDSAIDIIAGDGSDRIALLGHSTGGLTASLYMADQPSRLVKILMLNSPFLDWNMPWLMKKGMVPLVSALGKWLPDVRVHQKPDSGYAETLSNRYEGEWEYNAEWKPDVLPDPDMGWIHAIQSGQKRLRRQRVNVPVLLMHSTASVHKGDPKEKYFRADAILDVESISRYGKRLGEDVTEVSFEGGLHDLALSKKAIREKMYHTMLSWLHDKMP